MKLKLPLSPDGLTRGPPCNKPCSIIHNTLCAMPPCCPLCSWEWATVATCACALCKLGRAPGKNCHSTQAEAPTWSMPPARRTHTNTSSESLAATSTSAHRSAGVTPTEAFHTLTGQGPDPKRPLPSQPNNLHNEPTGQQKRSQHGSCQLQNHFSSPRGKEQCL
jgi:hypothetical protein